MHTIELQENISRAKYEMAVRVLEAIGIKVNKTSKEDFDLSASQEQMLLDRAEIVADENSKSLQETHKIIDECFK